MESDVTITTIAHVIQLAVAPVFLLTGIGSLLGVLTNRLSRIIDRRRVLNNLTPDSGKTLHEEVFHEFDALVHRGHLINRAIGLCTLSALLICIVIAALFVGAFLRYDMSLPIGVLFIAAMLALVGGLLHFLREIHLAMSVASVGILKGRQPRREE